jgi:hypothetical protein
MAPRQRRGCRSGLLAGKAVLTGLKGPVMCLSKGPSGGHVLPRQAVTAGSARDAGSPSFLQEVRKCDTRDSSAY